LDGWASKYKSINQSPASVKSGQKDDGVWIVGGVEITEQRKNFLILIEERSGATLMAIIREHVNPDSIIVTDCWRGYSQIMNEQIWDH
jgi:ISXO2-like transposase domain